MESYINRVGNKIDNLIEEATEATPVKKPLNALDALKRILVEKWDWRLTADIEKKFLDRFSRIKPDPKGFIAYDTKKQRDVYLLPESKSFVQVKDTGNMCGFLRGAVQASKNTNKGK